MPSISAQVPRFSLWRVRPIFSKWRKRDRSPARTQVLVAEDDSVFSILLDHELRHNSMFRPLIVRSGEELLKHLEPGQGQIIVLDHGLPGINGLQTMRLLKMQAPDARIVVLTQSRDPKVQESYMNEGANAFLLKGPKSVKKLLGVLEHEHHNMLTDSGKELQGRLLWLMLLVLALLATGLVAGVFSWHW